MSDAKASVAKSDRTEIRRLAETSTRAPSPTASESVRFRFWYWGVLRLVLGLAQIVLVAWCLILLIHNGINARVMHIAFIGVGITTLSLMLFKIVGKRP
jgi:hypothetical protein